MQRIAFTMNIKPGSEEEYRLFHPSCHIETISR